MELRDDFAWFRPQGFSLQSQRQRRVASTWNRFVGGRDLLNIAATQYPRPAQRRQAMLHLALESRVSPGARAIVYPHRFVWLATTIGEIGRAEADFAEGHAEAGVEVTRNVNPVRV